MATKFDAVAGSELRDTQGEILDVKGADISELEAGRGIINDNHSNKLPDVLGRITSAKKIFSLEDCDTDRQKYYWNKIKAAYIYTEGLLYDDEDHRSAKAAAAILKHQFRTDSPLKLKCSVEGGILERGKKDQRVLARTKIRGLALTFAPANNATLVEGLDLAKSAATTVEELDLIKSYAPYAVIDAPTLVDFSQKLSVAKIRENVEKINEIVGGLKKNISLEKAVPKAEANSYTFGTSDPAGGMFGGYTGKDVKNAQIRAIRQASDQEHPAQKPRNMVNLETGKIEPHILVHHGVNAQRSGDQEGSKGQQDGQMNVLHVKGGIVDHPTYGVHTTSHEVAHQYAGNDKNPGGIHSFWVPSSKIHAMSSHEQARYKNPNFKLPTGWEKNKLIVNEKGDRVAPDPSNKQQLIEAEKEYRDLHINDPQAEGESHISVMPGKYRQVSLEDIKAIHNAVDEWHRNKSDKTPKSQTNWITSPLGATPYYGEKGYTFYTKDGIVGGGLTKALTAGYGGADAPTSRTGGSVLQTEAMDSGHTFRYIDCPSCGKDQPYLKYQVKCRNCGKSFPFDTLAKFFISKQFNSILLVNGIKGLYMNHRHQAALSEITKLFKSLEGFNLLLKAKMSTSLEDTAAPQAEPESPVSARPSPMPAPESKLIPVRSMSSAAAQAMAEHSGDEHMHKYGKAFNILRDRLSRGHPDHTPKDLVHLENAILARKSDLQPKSASAASVPSDRPSNQKYVVK